MKITSKVILYGADLTKADLFGASLTTADARYLTLCNTIMPDGTVRTEFIDTE
ncbi:pentapeptide repeat-containing protein [Scytonema hofmannii]|uniref:pentapeptide repeat-containing protein n=1 Tax=Scytonema hofmannii TaxID=34078 RepID=UPI00036FA9F2|nr:pentapeptide repeat-containing protein [Scytonema hofmannii]